MSPLLRILSFLPCVSSAEVLDDSAADLFDDMPGLSLLQLRSRSETTFNASQPQYSGHPFGCTGRRVAENMISCSMWGDVHQPKSFFSTRPVADFNGMGWYWIAKSKDDSFQAQAFLRYNYGEAGPVRWTTLSHFAMKFGDRVLFMDREYISSRWIWKYVWDGSEVISAADTPYEQGNLYWVNKAAGELANLGVQGISNIEGLSTGDPERFSCFEYQDVAVFTSFQQWLGGLGPWGDSAIIEVEGNVDFLDASFGQCGGSMQKVDPKDMLVTIDQNQKVCSENKVSPHMCTDPEPPPAPPTKEEVCIQNNVDIAHAMDLCADQQVHGDGIYEGCVYDVCASVDAAAELNAVAGAELESAMVNPEATCVINNNACRPCTICQSATSVDLTNIVQNNLGGLGPDTGAEEIRYKNAIDLDGRKIDVVLTAEGEPVGVKDLALTFYDLDQAKKTRQVETISACGAGEVYTTSDTELAHDTAGKCHTFSSTTRGTGKDNPQRPDDLTKMQAARSVTFEFHSRASITFSAAITGSGRNPRQILFSFEPQVACGASDAETKCSQ